MKKTAHLVLLFLLMSCVARADHFAQNDIWYEFNGTNYNIYMTMYKRCETGFVNPAPLLDTFGVDIKSASLSISRRRQLKRISYDTLSLGCLNNQTACNNISSVVPGYIRALYTDTITLPPATDWVFSSFSCCNLNYYLNTTSYQSIYVEAILNSQAYPNSCPRINTLQLFHLTSNDTITIPFVPVDIDGDSIVCSLIAPELKAGISISFLPGYTATAPLPGICSLDNVKRQMVVSSNTNGIFNVGIKISEYRNGTLISTQKRFVVLNFLPNTMSSNPKTNTYPYPAPGTKLKTYTSAGTNNNITFSFLDESLSDSVFVNVITPNIPGWIFSSNTSHGAGLGSASISWTSPATINLSTLPYFYIRLIVRDNECPNNIVEYPVLVRTRSGTADSVWPGDANSDGVADMYDVLSIAVGNGGTGFARVGTATTWLGYTCLPWASVFQTDNVNIKHADCNGNGTIDATDIAAVNLNYNKLHSDATGGGLAYAPMANTDLYFDTTGIRFEIGKHNSVPLKLGTSTNTMNNTYGIATTLSIDGITPSGAPNMATGTGWLSTGTTSMLDFTRPQSPTSIDWVYSRGNQSNTSGSGTIATFEFDIPLSVAYNTKIDLMIDASRTRIIDNLGRVITGVNIRNATGYARFPLSVTNTNVVVFDAAIQPNPSQQSANIIFTLKDATTYTIVVTDITGKVIWNYSSKGVGKQVVELPAIQATGIYIVKLSSADTEMNLKWVKQ